MVKSITSGREPLGITAGCPSSPASLAPQRAAAAATKFDAVVAAGGSQHQCKPANLVYRHLVFFLFFVVFLGLDIKSIQNRESFRVPTSSVTARTRVANKMS